MAILPELDLSLDNFQKQKILNLNDSVAQLLINLFLMSPGNIPGLPHIGVNIKEYLYKTQSELNVDELKAKIATQCSELLSGIVVGNIDLVFIPNYNGQPMLIVTVEVFDRVSINIGFTKNAITGEVSYLYEIEKQLDSIQSQIGGI